MKLPYYLSLILLLSVTSCKRSSSNAPGLLSKVGNEKPLVVTNNYSGCFSSGSNILVIKKAGNGFDFRLTTIGHDSSTISGTMSNRAIRQYGEFERKGKKLPSDGGCTYISAFSCACGGEIVDFTDWNCNFREFNVLLELLKK
jgi:hypothetical protein